MGGGLAIDDTLIRRHPRSLNAKKAPVQASGRAGANMDQ